MKDIKLFMSSITFDPAFARIAEKRILATMSLDGETKVSCRKCGSEMELVDLGVSQSIQGGQLVEQELGFVWHCSKCGYTEDE